jgi:O-antigen/teichoic acid export membrane protein
MIASSSGGVINVVLNAVLIPRYGGPGAAVAATVSIFMQFGVYAWLLRHFLPVRVSAAGPLLSLAMGIVACATARMAPLHWIGQTVLALSIYLVAMLLVSAMTSGDIGALWRPFRGNGTLTNMEKS